MLLPELLILWLIVIATNCGLLVFLASSDIVDVTSSLGFDLPTL